MNNLNNNIFCGMSGGVDSSAAALLLQNAGYNVIGATMVLHNENTKEKEEADQNVFASEAMDCLYPFLRASVASITANCYIIPYVLPIINYGNIEKTAKPEGGLN